MKYNYNASEECFIREDGLGKKFHINSSEAQRILTMRDLGYTIPKICNKISFNSGKVYESTVKNFLKNVDNGDLVVSEDYPAPKQQVMELSFEDRLNRLESEFEEFKKKINDSTPDKSISDKVKSWLKS